MNCTPGQSYDFITSDFVYTEIGTEHVYHLGEAGKKNRTVLELDISVNTDNSGVFSSASAWAKHLSCSKLCLGVSGLREIDNLASLGERGA